MELHCDQGPLYPALPTRISHQIVRKFKHKHCPTRSTCKTLEKSHILNFNRNLHSIPKLPRVYELPIIAIINYQLAIILHSRLVFHIKLYENSSTSTVQPDRHVKHSRKAIS